MMNLNSETKENFENWLKDWDFKISTLDDHDSIEKSRDNINAVMSSINLFLHKSDEKAMSKYDTIEQRGKALVENQNKPFYLQFEKISRILSTEIYHIKRINELKNRKTKEILRLNYDCWFDFLLLSDGYRDHHLALVGSLKFAA